MTCTIQNLRRRTFNLVEITIALMILGTGLIAILGVFPIAANNSRDAAGVNYSAAAAEEMLHFIASRVEGDWSYVGGISNTLSDVSSAYGADATSAGFTKYLANGIGDSGIWGINTDPSIYRVMVQTSSSGGTLTAFDGIARVWKSPTTGFYYDGSNLVAGAEDATYSRSAQLNIEVSWPATLPYQSRRKAFYSLEVSKND